jgi:two-component system, NtrC family, sensor kinase
VFHNVRALLKITIGFSQLMLDRLIKILLVEDDEDDIFLFRELINGEELNPSPLISIRQSGGTVLEFLDKEDCDICFFDYRLGATDGIDLITKVREKYSHIPIILLTGMGDQKVAVEAMKAGANDYLSKEKLTGESLIHSMRYCLEIAEEAKKRKQAEEELRQSHLQLISAHQKTQESLKKLQSAQNQILISEKLAGVGRLAAGICHEILNPLNIISGHSQALMMERGKDSALMLDLESIMEEIHRIQKIISSLLKFSRKDGVELKPVNLKAELESVLLVVEKDLQLGGIVLDSCIGADLPEVLIDAGRMRQVFLNLINNAKHSMPAGGTLTLTTEVLTKERRLYKRSGKVPLNPNIIRIQFSDTGIGIKEVDMKNIFEPFFTTKPEDQGTGLGLAICHSIVSKHGGTLDVESVWGEGSTFCIDLPIITTMEENAILNDSEDSSDF